MDSHQIVLTFDVENDCSLETYKGIKLGLPKILQILKKYSIPATFFVTAEVAELFPKIVRDLSKHYEIGCHGYHHESLQKIDSHKKNIIKTAKKIIEETIDKEISGFRAPYLRVSHELFNTLLKIGFKYDSSLAWFKVSHWFITTPLKEFRLMLPNVYFRFPLGNHLFSMGCLLIKLPVLYFHPWECIDVRSLFLERPKYSWNLFSRPDRWFNSGQKFISLLNNLIRYHLRLGFQFRTLRDIYLNSS